MTTNLDEGRKDDAGKIRMDLVPPDGIEVLALVLSYGVAEYGARNWERGMSWCRVFAAVQRHLWAWARGEVCDKKTGYSHAWLALAGIMFLVVYELRSIGTDDRAKIPKSPLFEKALEDLARNVKR